MSANTNIVFEKEYDEQEMSLFIKKFYKFIKK
jgi:hypothetical protein